MAKIKKCFKLTNHPIYRVMYVFITECDNRILAKESRSKWVLQNHDYYARIKFFSPRSYPTGPCKSMAYLPAWFKAAVKTAIPATMFQAGLIFEHYLYLSKYHWAFNSDVELIKKKMPQCLHKYYFNGEPE